MRSMVQGSMGEGFLVQGSIGEGFLVRALCTRLLAQDEMVDVLFNYDPLPFLPSECSYHLAGQVDEV